MFEETGIGIKNPLWFVGVVENRNDPRKEGRVQVRAFGVHGTNKEVATVDLPWAICISGNYDPNYPIPPLNSWVFGFFLDGRDAQQPMILGLIPTQMTSLIDPEVNGWGTIPSENVNLHSQGSRAIDYGQPQNSRKARGEELHKTDVLMQEVSRVTADLSALEDGLVLEEPAPGSQPVYPFNRVMETAGGHSFELDDSPNAARVRLGHSEGQFIEMHQNGVTVLKSVNDLWIASEANIIIVAKAGQFIKVEGDAAFSVDGNFTQDVMGDMRQVVHGNYELSVGGQLNLNGGEEIQARAAKVRIESNVEGINLKAAKKINIQSGEVINIKSGQGIFQEAVEDINIKGDNLFIQGNGDINVKSSEIMVSADGNLSLKADHAIMGGGQLVSINASSVAIDDIVQLANGQAGSPIAASDSVAASPAEGTELPEPASKAVSQCTGGSAAGGGFASGGYKSPSVSGSGGYISQDDGGADGNQSTGSQVEGNFVAGDYADIEEALKAQGFSVLEITAALAIIGGESNGAFTAVETSYSGTSNERIRSIFNKTRSLTDAELTALKSNDTEFYNFVYGGKLGNGFGNNDGYDYRGRGLIQLTFKSNYERYAKLTGYDIVSNPSLVNTDKKIAATVTAAYLKDRVRRTGDPVADIRAAVAGTRTGRAFTMNIDKDRKRYARLLSERGII
jgi:predicted chitinase